MFLGRKKKKRLWLGFKNLTNGSNQQRRFETKLNLNLFKDMYKKLYTLIFVEVFYIFMKQLFSLLYLYIFNILIMSSLINFTIKQKLLRENNNFRKNSSFLLQITLWRTFFCATLFFYLIKKLSLNNLVIHRS